MAPVSGLSAIKGVAALASLTRETHDAPIIGSAQVQHLLGTLQSKGEIQEQIASGYDHGLPAGFVKESAVASDIGGDFLMGGYVMAKRPGT